MQQHVFLFGGTMREDIDYGRLDAPEAEILGATRRAQLDRLIHSLPDGLDAVISERGVRLSGGQSRMRASCSALD